MGLEQRKGTIFHSCKWVFTFMVHYSICSDNSPHENPCIDPTASIPGQGFFHCNTQSKGHHSKYLTLKKLQSFSKKEINSTF